MHIAHRTFDACASLSTACALYYGAYVRVVQSETAPVFTHRPIFVSDEYAQKHLVQVYSMYVFRGYNIHIRHRRRYSSESLRLRRTIALVPRRAMSKLTEIELSNVPSYDYLEPCTGPQPVTVRGWHPE